MKKLTLFTLSIFLFVNTKIYCPDQAENPANQNKNDNKDIFSLSENKARAKVNRILASKFGGLKKVFATIFSPILSQKTIDSIRLENDELRTIRNIATEKLESSNNYKMVSVRKSFVKYIAQVVKKPVEKKVIEWQELEKLIPLQGFKDVDKKRYDKDKLKTSIYSSVMDFIGAKSYEYTKEKTKSSSLATKAKDFIKHEMVQRIKLKKFNLKDFIGRKREYKIDKFIEQLLGITKISKNGKNGKK